MPWFHWWMVESALRLPGVDLCSGLPLPRSHDHMRLSQGTFAGMFLGVIVGCLSSRRLSLSPVGGMCPEHILEVL